MPDMIQAIRLRPRGREKASKLLVQFKSITGLGEDYTDYVLWELMVELMGHYLGSLRDGGFTRGEILDVILGKGLDNQKGKKR